MIAGYDNLFSSLIQSVERVEEFCLSSFLACNELYIVYEQDVHCPVVGAKIFWAILFNTFHHLVGKLFSGDVQYLHVWFLLLKEVVTYGMQKVCLPSPTPPQMNNGLNLFPGFSATALAPA